MREDRTPVVVAARRTPIGNAGGALRAFGADELAAPVLRAVLDDAALDTVDDVVLGNVFGPGGNPARVAALRAGLDESVPGMTVDRQCASGLAAITLAAALIRAGEGEAYLAGGVESASTAPYRAWRPHSPGETPRCYTRAPFAPAEIGDPDMGPAADLVAAEAGISRQRQDAFAARSHARAVEAQRSGRFAAELVPIGTADRDERPRPGFTAERLARFRPAFTPGGTATAANSCGISDGAAAVLLVSETVRRRLGLPGLRLVASATRAVDPNRLGLGAVPAMKAVLDRVPDVVEFNEAFAGQTLACLDGAGIDEQLAGPDGGAIALGHPWGASGAVLVVRLFATLVRTGRAGSGLAALSAGGGVGVATMWEAAR
ncbi:thiolase family protein [Nonomuraea cavernae]|uniref:Acetyl-CoA acetyltransferase n=1 Tax=Nonomuraea cavernae TaxID=2045107 RepID=A0A917Z194_9ACTN|nr:thiolase family protein [Nonomuraea cavernae]MCA2186114.1 thiolase family protein [Nonomuraea cavernae]GGO70171.1 acetyl-CoA acetyltransferase [Nonomuraea cavernae]